jgi:Mu transposase, C-terminal
MSVESKEAFVSRRLCNYGIKICGLHYNSHKLQEIRRFIGPNSEVHVRVVNPDDAACVYVHDRGRREWIKVPLIK